MRNLRLPAFLTAVAISVSTAFASTTIHELGHAPLLGVTPSTPELREKFAAHPELIREAARQIGLSDREYHRFMTKFNNEKPYWGEVPRHLDAMSWSADGHVYAVHDVIIPAGTNGWEVDLKEKHQIVAIYIPMACGNLSVVRRPIHEVAYVRPALPPPAVFTPPPAPAPVPLVAAEAPPVQQEAPPPAPAPVVHHPHLFWPIFAAAVVGIVIASNHHSHNSSTPVYSSGAGTAPGSGAGSGTIGTPYTPPAGHVCGCEAGNPNPAWPSNVGAASSSNSIGSNGISANI